MANLLTYMLNYWETVEGDSYSVIVINVLTLPSENENITLFSYFYNALFEYYALHQAE